MNHAARSAPFAEGRVIPNVLMKAAARALSGFIMSHDSCSRRPVPLRSPHLSPGQHIYLTQPRGLRRNCQLHAPPRGAYT